MVSPFMALDSLSVLTTRLFILTKSNKTTNPSPKFLSDDPNSNTPTSRDLNSGQPDSHLAQELQMNYRLNRPWAKNSPSLGTNWLKSSRVATSERARYVMTRETDLQTQD